jgi:hypothetical protein
MHSQPDNAQQTQDLLNQVVELLRKVVDLDDHAVPGKKQTFSFAIIKKPSEKSI